MVEKEPHKVILMGKFLQELIKDIGEDWRQKVI